jgi:hypothetical protein
MLCLLCCGTFDVLDVPAVVWQLQICRDVELTRGQFLVTSVRYGLLRLLCCRAERVAQARHTDAVVL